MNKIKQVQNEIKIFIDNTQKMLSLKTTNDKL